MFFVVDYKRIPITPLKLCRIGNFKTHKEILLNTRAKALVFSKISLFV